MGILHDGEFLQLRREGSWEFVRRQRASGAGFIVAVTPADELLLVEQFRVPLGGRSIELPAGIIGDSHANAEESPENSALRELEEETGYRGARARILWTGPVAPGMTSEIGHFVRVLQLEQVGPGGGVDGEDITVHAVALERIHDWLLQQQSAGLSVDPRIFVALHFLAREA